MALDLHAHANGIDHLHDLFPLSKSNGMQPSYSDEQYHQQLFLVWHHVRRLALL
jgi:hypothetical protein